MQSKSSILTRGWYNSCGLTLKKKRVGEMATSYEQKVLALLHTMLIEHDLQIGPGKRRIVVEEERLEPGGPEEGDSAVILISEGRRPHCLFWIRTSGLAVRYRRQR